MRLFIHYSEYRLSTTLSYSLLLDIIIDNWYTKQDRIANLPFPIVFKVDGACYRVNNEHQQQQQQHQQQEHHRIQKASSSSLNHKVGTPYQFTYSVFHTNYYFFFFLSSLSPNKLC